MSRLSGKVAIVTGHPKELEPGLRRCWQRKKPVVVNYASDRAGAESVVEAISSAGGRAIAVQADIAKAADVTRLFEQAADAFGRLHILVNNAGVYQAMLVTDLTEAEFHREIDVNLLGPLLTIRESLRYFGPVGGSIINIGSVASRSQPPGYAIYAASKAGLTR